MHSILLNKHSNFLAALAALYLPLSLIHWLIHSLCSIHTNLSRLCFAKHDAAHQDERTMPHTMFRHHSFNKISQFWQNFTILTEFHNIDRISQSWQNFTILTEFHNFNRISQFWQNFKILTELQNFDRISQFWQNFIILIKFLKIDKTFTIFSCPSSSIPTFSTDSLLWT